jgi:Cu(I)/Ag(I) efflux system membrane fusion protein
MRFYFFTIFILMSAEALAQQDHSQMQIASAKKDEARVPIEVPPEQQKRIGLKTTTVQKKIVSHTIRTIGTVAADQRTEAHVHSKLSGWIETIYADYVGKEVKKGGLLFDLYSPELVATQEEYISAVRQSGIGQELARAALDRLKLWGVPEREINRLKKTRKVKRTISFESPVPGFVISKSAIQGMYITPGMELYQIADLSKVWIMVTLYEYDVAIVKLGDVAEVQLPYDSKLNFTAKISYVSPEIEVETRTAKARIEVDNKNQNFKPGMYVNVILQKELGLSIIIPDDAVLDTGLRKIVFVKTSTSRFEPREIKVGPRVSNQFTILSGLIAGEEIVTSAHFFIDAESKLRAAVLKGSITPTGHGGHK